MAHRLDLTRTFVISLTLISLLAPNRPPTPAHTPASPGLAPTQTSPVAVVLKATATLPPTATAPPPTSDPTPTPTTPNETPATPTSEPTPAATTAATPTPRPPDPSPLPPTRLLIPAINLDAPILTVGLVQLEANGQPITTWDVPETFAVGWHHSSAPPGQVGNTVLNGHQNAHGRVFQNLAKTQAGDEIIMYSGDVAYHYRVAEQHLLKEAGQPLQVRAENARWIMPTHDERLTLVTCAPDRKSTHRLIVVALPIRPTPPSPFDPVAQ